MFIKRGTYKGFDYEVIFTSDGDWGTSSNKFYVKNECGFDGDFFDIFKDAEKAFKKDVDDFLSSTPETIEELADAISENIVWTGYEDYHLDREKTIELLHMFFKKGIKRESNT